MFCATFSAFASTKDIRKESFFSSNKKQSIKLDLDFKLKIEKDLKTAIAVTKKVNTKFLVVYSEGEKNTRKAVFDTFIKDIEKQLNTLMKDKYQPEVDVFNYYLAGAEDQNWLNSNTISNNPTVIILNGDGIILAKAESGLQQQQLSDFDSKSDFYTDLKTCNDIYNFNEVIKNKKSSDNDLVMAFDKLSAYEVIKSEMTAEKDKQTFQFITVALDKNELSRTWEELIVNHQEDEKPNIILAETIFGEIRGRGFYATSFHEIRPFSEVDFLSIDYLIKHYNAIQKGAKEIGADWTESYYNLTTQIIDVFWARQDVIDKDANNDKAASIYKSLMAIGASGNKVYPSYFSYLKRKSETISIDGFYLKEFSAFFDANFSVEKGNIVKTLDKMYKKGSNTPADLERIKDGLEGFKKDYAALCNSIAWRVVEKQSNSDYIKKAIRWSECSLVIFKNNPLYLDTLAQLYYKNGQKQKAIETQSLAVSFLTDAAGTRGSKAITDTLERMKNGTY